MVHAQGAVAAKDVGRVVSAAGTGAARSGTVDLAGVADTAAGLEKESTGLVHQDGGCTVGLRCCRKAQAEAAAVVHVRWLETERDVDWGAKGRDAAADLVESAGLGTVGHCTEGEETAGNVVAEPAVGLHLAEEKLMQVSPSVVVREAPASCGVRQQYVHSAIPVR